MKRSGFKRKIGKPMKRGKLARRSKRRSDTLIARDKAWNTFSLYIRTKAKFKCYTCLAVGGITNAGHFWHNVLDFDEENIHCQCTRCNHHLSGNLAVYGARLLREMGEDRFKALEQRHWEAMKGEKHDLQYYLDLITLYQQKLVDLQAKNVII